MLNHIPRPGAYTLLCVLLTLGPASPSPAQRQEILVDVTATSASGLPGDSAFTYLNGYASTVEGGTISYHSSHPDAEDALLCRAKAGSNSITWTSDTLPAGTAGDVHRLVWLAGIERIGWGNDSVSRTFEFLIEGEKWFTFTNRKDSTAGEWTVPGKDGARLTFRALTKDKFGDLFGHMFLDLPKQAFPPGRAVRFTVRAEDAGSPEWYMVFQYRFNFLPRVRVEPALVRSENGERALLRLSLDNLSRGGRVIVRHGTTTVAGRPLGIGANIFLIPVDAVLQEEEQPVVFRVNGVVQGRLSTTVRPVQKMSIHLVPHTHTDIGYTDLQHVVEEAQWRHLDTALALIEKTRSYPPEARFKWNLEVLWPFETYMLKSSPGRRDQVLEAVRSGNVGLNALLVNPLTGLATAPEMSHFMDYARGFTARTGVPITTAAVSDIPGFSWGIVTALAQSGVRYFASAPNSGDRIGYVLERWGDRPFYWKSQSGEEKVLFWVAGASYALFHQETLPLAGPEKLMKLLRKLEDTDYPYDIYFLPYTLGDNLGPDTALPDFVKEWNETYVSPRLVISTHGRLFGEFEKKYGATLPVLSGDFTPYWEDGAISSARETAMNRAASDRLVQGEILRALRPGAGFPEELYDEAWRKVTLFNEHTWGADISVSDPDDPETIGQWRIKERFALDADSLSRSLLRDALGTADGKGTPRTGRGETLPSDGEDARPGVIQAFDVWNTSSWPRTDVVFLPVERGNDAVEATDAAGEPLPSQEMADGTVGVLVRDVPPLTGIRINLRTATGQGETVQGDRQFTPVKAAGDILENEFLLVQVDTVTGAVSRLFDKRTSMEYVSRGEGLNRYVYVAGTNPDSARFPGHVKITAGAKGPVLGSFVVEAEAPGCRSYASEIRLVAGIPRVDIINTLDKEAVREKEGVHFAFPLNVPGGTLRYDVASGIVEPERNQLEGACRNFFSVQSWVDVSRPATRDSGGRAVAGYGVTWTTADAPLIEIGAITAEAPWMKSIEPSSRFFSYAMNNYWHTNYRAEQEGVVEFRYAIIPHGEFHAPDAAKGGREMRRPLIVAPAGNTAPGPPPVLVEPDDVLLESMKPLDGGGSWLLCLYNPSSAPREVSLKGLPGLAVWRSDPSGSPGEDVSHGLTIPGYGSLFLGAKYR